MDKVLVQGQLLSCDTVLIVIAYKLPCTLEFVRQFGPQIQTDIVFMREVVQAHQLLEITMDVLALFGRPFIHGSRAGMRSHSYTWFCSALSFLSSEQK